VAKESAHGGCAGGGKSPGLSQCDAVADGIDLSPLEHVSPIEWDKIVLYFQYILDLKLVRRDQRAKWVALAYEITRICPVP